MRLHDISVLEDLPTVYERLRAEYGQVAPVLIPGDLPAWLVLGYRENLAVTRTPSLFTREGEWNRAHELHPQHPLTPLLSPQPIVAFADGEEHQRWRKAITDSLAEFNRAGVRRYVVRFADQLIDGFAHEGRIDLVSHWAERLPMRVMTKLMGLPEETGAQLVEVCLDLMKGTETAAHSNGVLTEILNELTAVKRVTPGHDIVSKLLAHQSGLTDEEVVQHARLLLIAANETTIGLIINTLFLALTDGQFRGSLSGGNMTLPDGIERVLWEKPPLGHCPFRIARGTTDLGGQEIQEGDLLILGLEAGNTDPEIRSGLSVSGNRAHLSFSNGPHECPGQDLGRVMAEAGIDRLLTRLPDLQLDLQDIPVERTWLRARPAALPATFRRQPVVVPQADAGFSVAQPLPEPAPQPSAPAVRTAVSAPESLRSRLRTLLAPARRDRAGRR